mmetsp:Transcript_2966/g.5137  ORF Transcript_2966/g.5137 Transcript_2966/m.5137 type:complete len:113 (-) Transcript_2966:653-991(-)
MAWSMEAGPEVSWQGILALTSLSDGHLAMHFLSHSCEVLSAGFNVRNCPILTRGTKAYRALVSKFDDPQDVHGPLSLGILSEAAFVGWQLTSSSFSIPGKAATKAVPLHPYT